MPPQRLARYSWPYFPLRPGWRISPRSSTQTFSASSNNRSGRQAQGNGLTPGLTPQPDDRSTSSSASDGNSTPGNSQALRSVARPLIRRFPQSLADSNNAWKSPLTSNTLRTQDNEGEVRDTRPDEQRVRGRDDNVPNVTHNGGDGQSVKDTLGAVITNKQSLLEELFPEANKIQTSRQHTQDRYPKVDLPATDPSVIRVSYEKYMSRRDQVIESFQHRSEEIIALQLLHCSIELTESDFRRLVPKGKHIDTWARGGEFYKVIPGRDPINLERLPFYYLLFRSFESALAYQKNVGRLHKLSQLHQPSSIFSALPMPKGFLEDGEDINFATSTYLLKPTDLRANLNMVMQPYNPNLRALIEQGGYRPIVPSTTENGRPIWKVLLHIEGYEPTPQDLYHAFGQDATARGIRWPFLNDANSIHRLRDIADLNARLLPISSANPRAANSTKRDETASSRFDESDIASTFASMAAESEQDAKQVKQMIMGKVYNRWIIEFEEADAAMRFARVWNRRILPDSKVLKDTAWKVMEEVRMCNAEFLW